MSIHNIQEADALLLYRVGPVYVCSPTMQVEAVVMPPKFNATPGTNEAEPGVFRSIHGLVRVVDLRVRFGVDKQDASSPGRIIITEVEGGHAGFWVDEIEDIVSFPKTGWKPVPTHIPRAVFSKTLLMKEHIRLYAEFEQLDKFKASGYLRKHIEQIKQQEVRKEATQEKNIQQPVKSLNAGVKSVKDSGLNESGLNEREQIETGLTNKDENAAGDIETRPNNDQSRLNQDRQETTSSDVKPEDAREYHTSIKSSATNFTKASEIIGKKVPVKKSHVSDVEHNIKSAHTYSSQQKKSVPEVSAHKSVSQAPASEAANRGSVRGASLLDNISTDKETVKSRHSTSSSKKAPGKDVQSGFQPGAGRVGHSTKQPVRQVNKQSGDKQGSSNDDNGASVGLILAIVSLLIVAVLLYAFLVPEDREDSRRIIVRESPVRSIVKTEPVIERDYSEPVSRTRMSDERVEPEGKVTISQVENDMVIVVNDYEKAAEEVEKSEAGEIVEEVEKIEVDAEADKTKLPVASVDEAAVTVAEVVVSESMIDMEVGNQLVDEGLNDELPVIVDEAVRPGQELEDINDEKTVVAGDGTAEDEVAQDERASLVVAHEPDAKTDASVEKEKKETVLVEVKERSELTLAENASPKASAVSAASDSSPIVATKPPVLKVNKTSRHVHIVVKGDTLWHIANRYVNNPWRYPELARLSKIKNPDLIYPGQKIIIILNHK